MKEQISFTLSIKRSTLKTMLKNIEKLQETLQPIYDVEVLFYDKENDCMTEKFDRKSCTNTASLIISYDQSVVKEKKTRNAGRKDTQVIYRNEDNSCEILTYRKYFELSENLKMKDYEIAERTNIQISAFRNKKRRLMKLLREHPKEEILDFDY